MERALRFLLTCMVATATTHAFLLDMLAPSSSSGLLGGILPKRDSESQSGLFGGLIPKKESSPEHPKDASPPQTGFLGGFLPKRDPESQSGLFGGLIPTKDTSTGLLGSIIPKPKFPAPGTFQIGAKVGPVSWGFGIGIDGISVHKGVNVPNEGKGPGEIEKTGDDLDSSEKLSKDELPDWEGIGEKTDKDEDDSDNSEKFVGETGKKPKDGLPDWDDIGEKSDEDAEDTDGTGLIQPRGRKARPKRFIESRVYHVPLVYRSNAKPAKVKIQERKKL